jgi:hypothetical protein
MSNANSLDQQIAETGPQATPVILINHATGAGYEGGSQISTTTGTPTNVVANTTSVQLLASNLSRKSFSITNNGSANLYLGFGATPSTASFKYKLAPGVVYESTSVVWTGVVNGIWDMASGTAQISEES